MGKTKCIAKEVQKRYTHLSRIVGDPWGARETERKKKS